MGMTQVIGGVGAALFWTVLATANVDTLASYGSGATYIETSWGNLTTRDMLGALGLGVELLFIGAIYGVSRWWKERAYFPLIAALIVTAGCAGISWHSAKVWVETNIATVQAPATQSEDAYAAKKNEVLLAQEHYDWLLGTSTSKMNRQERREHKADLAQAKIDMEKKASELAAFNIVVAPQAIENFPAYVATVIVVLNILGWFAVFGSAHPGKGVTAPVTPAVTPGVTPGVTPRSHPGVTALVTPDRQPLVSPKKPNAINGVTPESPAPVSPAVTQVTPPPQKPVSPPPDTPESPPGVTAGATPESSGVVVTLADHVVPAVRRWVRSQDDGDPTSFLPATEAWEAYCASGGPDMPKDDFFKAMKEIVGEDRCTRKKTGRGYAGLKIRTRSKAAATT